MKNFLGDKYEDEDINQLVYYLDSNNDGLISYDDFENFFVTLSISQQEINKIKNQNENKYINNKKNIIDKNFENKMINEETNNKYYKSNRNFNIDIDQMILTNKKLIEDMYDRDNTDRI